ncbi:MAG: AAA family ATPase, partial [Acetobacteraceae bacterium]|nr:AAA family ATPase [Acetobacteraceae bacterium]
GAARRRLQVQKLRGVDFIGGFHDFTIRRGGLEVYPRLIATEHAPSCAGEPIPSGIVELDAMLDGGPLRGTSTLLTGPAGTGKTTITLQYIYAACERGERATLYEFDERVSTLRKRADAFHLDIQRHLDSGSLRIEQVDPAELSPGEFTSRVRDQVERRGIKVLIIDSLSGYMAAMPQEKQLILQLHELLSYLSQKSVATFLVDAQPGLLGTTNTNVFISYIADVVLMLRFFEAGGRMRKAISVLKNRAGRHEDTIREVRIDSSGIRIGAPLIGFRGVMTGSPEYVGGSEPLMEDRGRDA